MGLLNTKREVLTRAVSSAQILLLGVLSPLSPVVAHAADDDYKIPEITWAMDAKTSAAEKSANNMAQIVATCQANSSVTSEALNASTKAMETVLAGKTKNIATTCSKNKVFHATMDCGVGSVSEATSATCDMFKGTGGLQTLQAEVARAETASCTASCNIGKANAIAKELNCVQTQINQVRQAVQSELQTGLSNSINSVTRISQNLNRSQEFVASRLGGSKTGEKGWLALQKEADATYNAMVSEINNVKGSQTVANNAREQLRDSVQAEIASRSLACMRTTAGDSAQGVATMNLQCVKRGPQVAPVEWITCQLKNGARINSRGRQDQYKSQSAVSDDRISSLTSILNNITNSGVRKLDIKAIDASFGQQLSALNVPNFDVRAAVLRTLAGCQQAATARLNAERASYSSAKEDTGLRKSTADADLQDRGITTMVEGLLNKYAQFFSKAISDLNGVNFPLDVSNCRKWTDPVRLNNCKEDLDCRNFIYAEQNKCLDQLKVASEAVLRGTVDSSVPLTFSTESTQIIPGAEAGFGIQVTCRGIDGCVRTYQNVSQNIDQRRTQIIIPANQQIDQYVGKMNTLLSEQNGKIQMHLATLNEHMGKLGVGAAPFSVDPIELTPLEKTGEGLDAIYQMPNPIVKADKDGMRDALKESSSSMKLLVENEAKAKVAVNKLKSLATSCPREGVDTLVQNLANENRQLNSCASIVQVCGAADGENSSLDSAQEILRRVQGLENISVDSSAYGSLQRGYIVSCPNQSKLGISEQNIVSNCISASTNYDQILAKVEKKDKSIGAAASAFGGNE